MGIRRRTVLAVTAAALLSGACSETDPATSGRSGSTTTPPVEVRPVPGAVMPTAGDGRTVVSEFAGKPWFGRKVPTAPKAADASATPVRIGFINADAGAIGTLPELHAAADAAVAFINTELGGVGGHPVQLVACAVDISPEQSQVCANKMIDEKVVAVLGGIDIASGAAKKILDEHGIPWVGGIPLNHDEMASPLTFQFSGGSPGAFTAFADHAAHTLKAKRVAVIYLDLDQVKVAAKDFGVALLQKDGVEVTEVSFSLTTSDYAAIVQRAMQDQPDAIMVGAADFACPKTMQAISDLGVKVPVYLVGSCADAKWVTQVGADKVKGTIFNVENRVDQTATPDADFEVYTEVMKRYGKGTNAIGAATVSFRGAMNLWAVLDRLGPSATSAQIVEAFRAARKAPSYDGHPYTCDGKQVPGLPGLCAPQQVLAKLNAVNDLTEISKGWMDVPRILADGGIRPS